MRISVGIVRNQHGVFHLRKKVPKKLEEAVAVVTGSSKPRVAWLKKTLGTKDVKAAKVRSVPLLMDFDRILAQAEAVNAERPLRTSLSEKEIERIAEYHFANVLAEDEEMRRDEVDRSRSSRASLANWRTRELSSPRHFMLGQSRNTASVNAKCKNSRNLGSQHRACRARARPR